MNEELELLLKQMMLFSYADTGYLKKIGWVNSFLSKMPVDLNNNPLPWVTYPFIHFMTSERLSKVDKLFEYGSGNSTLYYAKLVNYVTSVEHDISWYNNIKEKMPENVVLNYVDLVYGGDYCKSASSSGVIYDLIIVDGRDRVNSMKDAINAVGFNGCIVLDDSERDEYKEGIEFLINNHGYKKIDFWGISPGLNYLKNTSIFYRCNNVLGI
jgi:hypothetical protein